MNQRSDTPGGEPGERGRETNGGQYERDNQARGPQSEDRERWHSGFERSPSYRSRESGHGQEQRYGQRGGQGSSPSDQYRPVSEEWEPVRGYGDGGRDLAYGAGQD